MYVVLDFEIHVFLQIRFALFHDCKHYNCNYDPHKLLETFLLNEDYHVHQLEQTLQILNEYYADKQNVHIVVFHPKRYRFDAIELLCNSELEASHLFKKFTKDRPLVLEVGNDHDDMALIDYLPNIECKLHYKSFLFDKIYLNSLELRSKARKRVSYICLTSNRTRGVGLEYFHTYHLTNASSILQQSTYIIRNTSFSNYTTLVRGKAYGENVQTKC